MSLCAQHKIALKINKAKAVRRKQTEFYSRAKRLDFYHKLVLRTIKNLKSPRRLGRMATEAYTEFRYLLVRLARQLHHENCEDLIYVHKIAKSPDAANQGLYVLSRLEAEGHFDPYTPEKLQEILSKISRKDLAHDIKEYKHSSAYKKAVKLEQEREKEQKRKAKKKGGKDEGHGEASEEREEAARLLSHTAKSQEERQWMDMFAMALTHTAQLVEQMKLLRKAIQSRGNAEHTHRRVEDAVQSIETAQDEVETLSKTLKKAISAAGLKSRRASQEGLLDDDSPDEGQDLKKKQPFLNSPQLRRGRANTHDGSTGGLHNKTSQSPTSSLSVAHTPGSTSTATPLISPIPVATPSVPIPIPITTPTIPSPATSTPTSTPTQIKKGPPPPVKQKPPSVRQKQVSMTPDFHHKQGQVLTEGVTARAPDTPAKPHTSTAPASTTKPHTSTAPASTTKPHTSTAPASPTTSTSPPETLGSLSPEEPLYENIPQQEETEEGQLYMNMHSSGNLYMNHKRRSQGFEEEESHMMDQSGRPKRWRDSGVGPSNDGTWPASQLPHQYQYVKHHQYTVLPDTPAPSSEEYAHPRS